MTRRIIDIDTAKHFLANDVKVYRIRNEADTLAVEVKDPATLANFPMLTIDKKPTVKLKAFNVIYTDNLLGSHHLEATSKAEAERLFWANMSILDYSSHMESEGYKVNSVEAVC